MSRKPLLHPSRAAMIQQVLAALDRYWPGRASMVGALPVGEVEFPEVCGPLRLQDVALPPWAASCGVDGAMLVPVEACRHGCDWRQVDWWLAGFLLLECWHERCWERRHGPIHSYSFRLQGWDSRVWDRAWVNRIGLFLRAWGAFGNAAGANDVFGPTPKGEVLMTHDVDAVVKTWPIRIKQGCFSLFNAGRAIATGDLRRATARLGQAVRFLFGREDWWTLDRLIEKEREAGIRSQFNVFADRRRKTPKRWFFDPDYDPSCPRLSSFFARVRQEGWTLGLHPSFDAWQDPALIRKQRENLEAAAGTAVQTCRQHWLRFSWDDTWSAQFQAGIRLDTTLMFNDRMGFRCAGALRWAPWNSATGHAHGLMAFPTVLMDSHVYDYQPLSGKERRESFRYWLDEVFAVGGEIAVLWHPHSLSQDYGWNDGFLDLVEVVAGERQ